MKVFRWILATAIGISLAAVLKPAESRADETILVQNQKWTVSQPILTKRDGDALDNVAVKDPSIVFYDGKYHLFYTAKSVQQTNVTSLSTYSHESLIIISLVRIS